jgi:general secretion pathway protein G
MDSKKGYTLIELMMVVAIIATLAAIFTPHFDTMLQKAYQAKAKGNLGLLRSAISIYYSDNEGKLPLSGLPIGYAYQNNATLTLALVPRYTQSIPTPRLMDRMSSFNGLPLQYDEQAIASMQPSYSAAGPNDVYIRLGAPAYTAAVNAPFVYDNDNGVIYYCNGNYDSSGNYFYEW